MKAQDLKTKTLDELKKVLLDLKKEQFNLRFQKAQGQTGNTAHVRAVRRNVARVKTFMTQKGRELAAGTTKKKSGKTAA